MTNTTLSELQAFRLRQYDALNEQLKDYVLWAKDKANGEMLPFNNVTIGTLCDLLDNRYCTLKPRNMI